MKPVRENNLELEGVRGIACLLVALSHTLYLTHLDPTVNLPAWLHTIEAGHTGVLVFFVLSGFVIGWTNPGGWSAAGTRDYVRRRLVRLAPIYYVAMVLTVAVLLLRHDEGQKRVVVAMLLGLQNFNDYFGLLLLPPLANGPLWSLNYELLYYAVFIAVWRWQPRLGWIFAPALVAGVLGWFTPQYMPLFIASYACGWLYWAAGWELSKQPVATNENTAPALTWLLLIFAEHHLNGGTRVLNALGLHSADAGMVTLGQLGALPPILLLIAAIARRQLPWAGVLHALAWLTCLVPLAGMLWTGRLWHDPNWITGGVAVLLAAATLGVRGIGGLRYFAGMGRISYAFYVVHFPLLFVVQRLPVPSGTVTAYFGRIGIWAILSVSLAWFLEMRFQPWIKTRLPQLRFV